ncbi:MAG: dephospho-CoA kinase [Erysipelotrichaceae bacterium]|nr:dephospho-CoA kinase [Erysipelotrichaceae bacterium]
MLIAITGSIGSGKSYLLKLINKHFKYDTFSCDDFVKEAYENEGILNEINKVFNCVNDQILDKNALKNKLDADNIKILNNIIHPFVIKKIKRIKEIYTHQLAFVEVPLLFESNLQYLFDYSIAIFCDDAQRHEALYKRNPKEYKNMLFLESNQLTNEQKAKKANFIIESHFNEQENIVQLKNILISIKHQEGL